VSAEFGAETPFDQFGCNGFGLCADMRRISAHARAVDAVLFGRATLTADGTLSGIGLNAEKSKMSGELGTPVT
jgi:hypothetical protein